METIFNFVNAMAWIGLVISGLTVASQLYYVHENTPYIVSITQFAKWPIWTLVTCATWLIAT